MLFHSFSSAAEAKSITSNLPSIATATSASPVLDDTILVLDTPESIPHVHEENPVVVTSPTSSALPRLISIVEIVKRLYVAPPSIAPPEEDIEMAGAAATTRRRKKGKGKSIVNGLHQYTRLGSLESIGLSGEDIPDDQENEEEIERQRQEKVTLNWIESGAGRSKR